MVTNIPPGYGTSPAGSPQDDPEGLALYNELESLTQPPSGIVCTSLVNAILKDIKGPPYDHHQILQNIANIFSATYTDPKTGKTCDVYMEFNIGDSGVLDTLFIAQVNAVLQPYGDACPTPPNSTPQDELFTTTIIFWMVENPNSPAFSLAQAYAASFRSNIGSQGDVSLAPSLFTQIMTSPDFFTDYPQITPANISDLQSFCKNIHYSLPDYTLQYLQVGHNWSNPNGNADDTKLQKDLLALMQTNWAPGASYLNALQEFATTEVTTNEFKDYPALDISGAQDLENIIGLLPNTPIPGLQTQFFQARAWMQGLTSGSPAYSMAKDLMSEISTLWAKGQSADLSAWYNKTYGSSEADLFMTYYNVDVGDSKFSNIEMFYQIATNSTNTISPTTADNNLRDAANYRDSISDHNSPDWKLTNTVVDYLLNPANGLSNPTAAQLAAAIAWAKTVVGTDNFINSNATTQSKFFTYFPDYSVSLTYDMVYLNIWGSSDAPAYKQSFAVTMERIISSFLQTHPKATKTDFQNYLNENYSQTDYCFEYPGLAPSDLNALFGTFNLSSPYTFQPIDTVFANVYNALQAATAPLDKTFLEQVYNSVLKFRSNPTQYPLSTILNTILTAANSSTWSQYQQTTRDAISAIFANDSTLGAYQTVFNQLSQLPKGSVDATVFTNLMTTLSQTINDPVDYPYATNVIPAIKNIMNSPQWAQLQASSQAILTALSKL